MVTRVTSLAISVLLLGALAAPVQARTAPRGVISTLERSVSRLGKTWMADRTFTVVDTRAGSIWIRPQNKVIGVSKGFTRTGFILNANNQLSTADRMELGRMIRTLAPGTNTGAVRTQLAGEIRRVRQHQRTLERQDPVVQRLLDRARTVTGTSDVVLWENGRASLVYRPMHKVLVGSSGLSSEGFFLRDKAGALSVDQSYLNGLRGFLHRHAPAR